MITAMPPSEFQPGVQSASNSTHSPTDMKLVRSNWISRWDASFEQNISCAGTILLPIYSRVLSTITTLYWAFIMFAFTAPFNPFAIPFVICTSSIFFSALVIALKVMPYSVVSGKDARTSAIENELLAGTFFARTIPLVVVFLLQTLSYVFLCPFCLPSGEPARFLNRRFHEHWRHPLRCHGLI
jgi:hypothetical protein